MENLLDLSPKSLHFTRKIPVSSELLWHYLSTAEGLACWQADTVEGSLESGNFTLRWPELGARLDLSVAPAGENVDPERQTSQRILLRAGATQVGLTASEGLVELVHSGLDGSDDLEGFASSWETALRLLEIAAVHHPRAPRHIHWLFASIKGGADLLQHFFTDRHALGSWLGATATDFSESKPYKIKLFGGGELCGTALYTKRDVCLQTDQLQNGVITFRSLPGPHGERIVAVAISTWKRRAPAELIQSLEGALHRLEKLTEVKHS